MSFEGFSKKTMDFLIENRIQNSKLWFTEHRSNYDEYVVKPLRDLVVTLTPAMLEIDPLFTVTPTINKTISRIYRDTRFSRDKSLFRDQMWITFMRDKRFWQGLPGYYFLFGPEGLFYGVGYYEASRESMDCFRQMILRREKPFLDVFEAYSAQDLFTITGERYKRTKFPDEPEKYRNWLDLKNIDFERKTTDFDLLFSPRLAQTLADGFNRLKPMYNFICAIEQRRQHSNIQQS